MIMYFLIAIGIVVSDIITKYFATTVIKLDEIALIKNVLYFHYTENRGAAFGILKNCRWLFITITIAVIIAVVIYIIIKKPKSRLLLVSLAMITGGGIGNLIDRISLSYVVDFIDFRIINFPVFNVADIFVSIGAALMFIYIIFFEEKHNDKKDCV